MIGNFYGLRFNTQKYVKNLYNLYIFKEKKFINHFFQTCSFYPIDFFNVFLYIELHWII